jgi:non-canonical (house-cleaning) NTP pyrophosphatase
MPGLARSARNRLDNLRRQLADSATRQEGNRLLEAIEGGVGPRAHDQRLECFAWVAVGTEASSVVSTARSSAFILPPALEELVKSGMELGAADDEFFQRKEEILARAPAR